MKMIIAICKRGESVFEQRLQRENNYEAVISINTLIVKYLQNILESPHLKFRTSPLENCKESSLCLQHTVRSPCFPHSLNLGKHGC